jgi:hypothetical protein
MTCIPIRADTVRATCPAMQFALYHTARLEEEHDEEGKKNENMKRKIRRRNKEKTADN